MPNLTRFLTAQQTDYQTALSEIKAGKKRSHWMWYIFPQLKGLGYSETAKFYAIKNIEEAIAYLNHHILGERLREISSQLLKANHSNPTQIFGIPDDLKLKSSMTLFAQIDKSENSIFKKVIDKFYNGNYDSKTLELLSLKP